MALALSGHPAISRLAVLDIAPSKGKISPEFVSYLSAMKEIESARVANRKQATEILQKYERVRRFACIALPI
jgi:hypothetical protein